MITEQSLIKVNTLKASHAKQIECVPYNHSLYKELFKRVSADINDGLSDPTVCEVLGWAANTFNSTLFPEGHKVLLVQYNRSQLFWCHYHPDTTALIIKTRNVGQLFI